MEKRAEGDADFREAYRQESERVEGGEDMGVFVKTVENVQGDERDVIVFSTTFGRNSQGIFRRRLGVLGQKGGERRLNVAVTRARALDYCPPVDITFGEYLRALITADMDLYPEDRRGYRIAFVEAFRRRGIYPGDIRTLSEDSLRWARPGEDPSRTPGEVDTILGQFIEDIQLRSHVDKLRYLGSRKEIWTETRKIRAALHTFISNAVVKAEVLQRLTGLALAEYQAPEGVKVRRDGVPVFSLRGLREARRTRENGRSLNQVFITFLQSETMEHQGQNHKIRCGSTLVIDLDEMKVKYVIGEGLHDNARLMRTIAFKEAMENVSLARTYLWPGNEPFAALHDIFI